MRSLGYVKNGSGKITHFYSEKKNGFRKITEGIKDEDANESLKIEIKYKSEIRVYKKYDNKIPEFCGAYILHFASGLEYIGSAKNLRGRILSHNVIKKYKKELEYVILFLTINIYDAVIVEYSLIKELKPALNMQFDEFDYKYI